MRSQYKQRRSFCPRLEILEDRTLPSVYTVDRLTDAGAGSGLTGDLRYSITLAQNGDSIRFADAVTGTINLTSALPNLTKNVSIEGPGADVLTVRRDTGGNYRVLFITDNATVSISGLTISNGFITSNGGSGITVFHGSLTADGIILSGNTTTDTTNGGPAILSDTATVTIRNSAIVNNNSSGVGGGIFNFFNSTMTVVNTTISGNTAATWDGGAIWNYGTLTLVNSTIANNHAVRGGGIAVRANTVSLLNTIVSGNTATSGDPDISGTIISSGYNLIGNTSGGSGFSATDLLNVNPLLGPLQDNGGSTPTMALLSGSPAINAGTANGAPSTDQRGVPRLGGISIGAYQDASTDQLELSGNSAAVAGEPFSLTVTATRPSDGTDTDYTGTVHFTSSDPAADLPDDYTFSADDQGQHTFALKFNTLGPQSVTATDTVTSAITGSLASVMVGTPTLTVSEFPVEVTAADPNTFKVLIHMPDGAIDTSYRGTVHFTSTDPRAILPHDYAFTEADAGSHVFGAVFLTAGTQSLTATDVSTDAVTGTEEGIVVAPAAPASILITGLASSIEAGDVNTFTLTVVDAFGNVVTAYHGTVHFTSGDTTAFLPRNYTFTDADAGTHIFAFVLFTPGHQTIKVKDIATADLAGQMEVDVLA